MRAVKGREPAPFVVGAARSGTTMLRMMLNDHGELAIPPETQLLPELIDARDAGATPAELAELLVTHRRFPDFGLDPDEARRRFAAVDPFDPAEAIRGLLPRLRREAGEAALG